MEKIDSFNNNRKNRKDVKLNVFISISYYLR